MEHDEPGLCISRTTRASDKRRETGGAEEKLQARSSTMPDARPRSAKQQLQNRARRVPKDRQSQQCLSVPVRAEEFCMCESFRVFGVQAQGK